MHARWVGGMDGGHCMAGLGWAGSLGCLAGFGSDAAVHPPKCCRCLAAAVGPFLPPRVCTSHSLTVGWLLPLRCLTLHATASRLLLLAASRQQTTFLLLAPSQSICASTLATLYH